MKFYNYFEPHIVECGDYYYVRKLTIFGFAFYDDNVDIWWSASYIKKYCRLKSLDEAKKRLKEASTKFVKVEIDK